MFERLMNLDVELMCLGTKIFVAKEDLKDKVLYSKSRKGKDQKKNDEIEPDDIADLVKEILYQKKEGNDTEEMENDLMNRIRKCLENSETETKGILYNRIKEQLS